MKLSRHFHLLAACLVLCQSFSASTADAATAAPGAGSAAGGQSTVKGGTLNLVPSWNLVGNGVNTPITVAETFADATKVSSVWKWLPETGKWAFYSPAMADGGATYTMGKGYDLLTTINEGEGFWVNANAAFAVSLPAVTAACGGTGTALNLGPSWNLAGNNVNTPMDVGATFGDPGKVSSVWKWVPSAKKWAFYSPTMADGGKAYAAGKSYDLLATINAGEGFWVNTVAAQTVPLPAIPVGCECDRAAQLDKAGNVIFPPEATDTEPSVSVDEDHGSIAALYPGFDTTTDAFYPRLPCEPSLGGTLPADAEAPPTQGELDDEAFVAAFEANQGQAIADALKLNPMPAVSQLAQFTVGDCFIKTAGTDIGKIVPCDSPLFLDSSQPFEGRDIIYVHGFVPSQISDKLMNPPGPTGVIHPSNSRWPQDSADFLNAGGYFRTSAENYWKDHINEHLTMGWQWMPSDGADPVYKTKANRYLIVAWSSNQTIEYAQHTLLTQIQLAITSNKNVVTPSSYPATFVRPFCSNGCIVISHSTGAPIMSTAMGLASSGGFGPGATEITHRIVAHVSFAGAMSGSRLASISMALALGTAPVLGFSNVLCSIDNWLLNASDACNADTSFIAYGIMRDLMPVVMQGVWGNAMGMSPVPTVTFAGGHPTGSFLVTGFMLPGLDDGVVSMNSACGNPNLVFPGVTPPSGLLVTSRLKAFDMTEDAGKLLRSVKNFINQRNLKAPALLNYLAGTCTPYLSPTGMVMPAVPNLLGTLFDPRNRYGNHFSFMQSLGEHGFDVDGNPWPSKVGIADPATTLRQYKFFGTNNVEESRVVTDPAIYTQTLDVNGTHLVKPLDMHEIVRGRKVSFHMPFNIGNCQRQSFGKWYCHLWIWKRTYHLADKWERKQSSHYAYEFVGRR